MQSFEEDATKVLFEFTARSVMSPFHTWIEMQLVIKQKWKDKEMMHIWFIEPYSLHAHDS